MSRAVRYEPDIEFTFLKHRMDGFEGALFKATRGDAEPLVSYFLQADGCMLTQADCCGLGAFLAEKFFPLRKEGRPRGSVTPKTRAIAYAGCLVRIGKAEWRRKHGCKRASKAATENLIKRAIELVEAKIPEARGQIRAHAVRNEGNLRPRMDVVDVDDLYEEIEEIIELALK